jgi:hypothetical protein
MIKNKFFLIFLCFGILNLIPLGQCVPNEAVYSQTPQFIEIPYQFEGVLLNTQYSLPTNLDEWRITSNKAINMSIECTANPSNAIILIEHMHADIFIESHSSHFDDLLQDSMDDSFHGDQGGFLVSTLYDYQEIFSIEGNSPSFKESISQAILIYNHYSGITETSEYKYSEEDLRDDFRVYGQTIYIIYDILIKYTGEDYFHKYIIADNIFINLEGEITNNNENQYDVDPTVEDEIDGFPSLMILSSIILSSSFVIFKYSKSRRIQNV